MGPTWGSPGSSQSQMGPILAPRTLLSGLAINGQPLGNQLAGGRMTMAPKCWQLVGDWLMAGCWLIGNELEIRLLLFSMAPKMGWGLVGKLSKYLCLKITKNTEGCTLLWPSVTSPPSIWSQRGFTSSTQNLLVAKSSLQPSYNLCHLCVTFLLPPTISQRSH